MDAYEPIFEAYPLEATLGTVVMLVLGALAITGGRKGRAEYFMLFGVAAISLFIAVVLLVRPQVERRCSAYWEGSGASLGPYAGEECLLLPQFLGSQRSAATYTSVSAMNTLGTVLGTVLGLAVFVAAIWALNFAMRRLAKWQGFLGGDSEGRRVARLTLALSLIGIIAMYQNTLASSVYYAPVAVDVVVLTTALTGVGLMATRDQPVIHGGQEKEERVIRI